MKDKLNILLVDDEQRVLDEIEEFLKDQGYAVRTASHASDAFAILGKHRVDIMIVDIKLPNISGLEILEKVKQKYPEIEVIMISGHGDMSTVIEAMRKGATDYFPKPFRLVDINNSVLRTKRFITLNKKLKAAKSNIDLLSQRLLENIGSQLLGDSPAMKKLTYMMAKVAQADNTSVLILGESGTGKELVAHGIHYLSKRNKKMFFSVNCSAVPESLFESEFFGHTKGSFTGANEDKSGWFEIADEGTLFLDEISDMPLTQQAKLLRILEERKVSKVGSRQSKKVDVRVIAASNRDLEKLASENKFRLDLFHRLSIFIIEIPPLRERKEDIPILLDFYVRLAAERQDRQIPKIDPAVMSLLKANDYPGNVRELKNMIERAIILCEGNTLLPEHFSAKTLPGSAQKEVRLLSEQEEIYDLEENEKNIIVRALEKCEGNKSKAANLLNITWQALDRRLKKFGLE